jgi:hypothetical protein
VIESSRLVRHGVHRSDFVKTFDSEKEGPPLSSELSASWVAEAERVLHRLRDVIAASITTDGDEIKEIHIVAVSTRSPKHIVRDVETALKAFLKRAIDHRMISVALQEPDPATAATVPAPAVAAPVGPTPAAPAAPAAPAPAAAHVPGNGAAATAIRGVPLASGPGSVSAPPASGRVHFVNANLFVSGLRTQAEVELSWQGTTRVGNATGASARDNAFRLLSSATLSALVPFLGSEVTFAPHDVQFVRVGRQKAVVVAVKLLAQRSEKTLVGSCTVEQDVAQSVVFATLAAVNRVLGGLKTVEEVEYELRPTST